MYIHEWEFICDSQCHVSGLGAECCKKLWGVWGDCKGLRGVTRGKGCVEGGWRRGCAVCLSVCLSADYTYRPQNLCAYLHNPPQLHLPLNYVFPQWTPTVNCSHKISFFQAYILRLPLTLLDKLKGIHSWTRFILTMKKLPRRFKWICSICVSRSSLFLQIVCTGLCHSSSSCLKYYDKLKLLRSNLNTSQWELNLFVQSRISHGER